MKWRSFFSGIAGGIFVLATLSFPVMRAQTSWSVFPQGITLMVVSGSCPHGFSEVSALSGNFPIGTVAANMDVGGTGGSNTATPTVATLTAAAQTFSGNSGTVPAETFTGSSANTSAVTAGTPAGTNTAGTVSWPAGVPTFSGSALATHTHTVTPTGTNGATTTSGNTASTNIAAGTGSLTAAKATAPNLTVPAEVFTGASDTTSAVSGGTPAGTVAWPAGVPTVTADTFAGAQLATHLHTVTATGTNGTVSFTPSGSNGTSAVTGTINSVSTVPAYVKVIYCQKT